MNKAETTAKEYLYEWLDKKYGGSPTIEDWSPEDVIQFAEDYHKAQSLKGEGEKDDNKFFCGNCGSWIQYQKEGCKKC